MAEARAMVALFVQKFGNIIDAATWVTKSQRKIIPNRKNNWTFQKQQKKITH